MATAGVIPRLSSGLVSIYGTASIYGYTLPNNSNLTFGVIYEVADSTQNAYSVGQNVLLPYTEAYSIIYQNRTYWLINENKIILVEVQPASEPEP